MLHNKALKVAPINNFQERSELQGVGLGLRSCHYDYIFRHQPQVPWFEVLADNYLGEGGYDLYCLNQIRQNYPVALHGVGMSLGSTDPLNMHYLNKLKQLVERIAPVYVSDHLCWISIEKQYFHDLLPLPYTQEVLNHVVERIKRIQDYLGRQILIENIASYLHYKISEMTEWEFLAEIAAQADCFILLDINNIYVSAQNQNFNPQHFLMHLDPERVKQIHLGGYSDKEKYLFDTHNQPVHPPVWELYRQALQRFGAVPTCIEWDSDIPSFEILQAEADKASVLIQEVSSARIVGVG